MFWEIKNSAKGGTDIVVSGIGEFDLADTLECGQCFRYERVNREGYGVSYIVVAMDRILELSQRSRGEVVFHGISEKEFLEVAVPYFSLDTDFEAIRQSIISACPMEKLVEASEGAKGTFILRQDPWEALFSFIVSQNNNIPRIRKIIRSLSLAYGENIAEREGRVSCPLSLHNSTPCRENCKECGVCYSFPTAAAVAAEPEKMLPSKPGFRYRYLFDAAERVANGEIDLAAIRDSHDLAYSLESLKKIKGVGDKVASCVALFGLGNLDAFPIDVWMRRAIDTWFDGKLDPALLGEYAGVAQQYIFHYARNLTDESV